MTRNDQERNWRMARRLVALLVLQIIETEDIVRGTVYKVRKNSSLLPSGPLLTKQDDAHSAWP